ncbi:MAG: class I SAM-dependent methyltransferase, partial [Candidatus Hodarchaeota archaeon]
WKKFLIEQRKYQWFEDTVDKLATWMHLKHGMIVVDVGCGLGQLGLLYWPHFGKKGRYIGLDISHKLLRDAKKTAKTWIKKGKSYFITADAYKLPFSDAFADCVMCQTLLYHLTTPQRALEEMVRIVKPEGIIVCKDLDYLSTFLAKDFTSLPELTLKEQLLSAKVLLISHKGRIKLGRGDNSIGRKIPIMMKEAGLVDIVIKNNDLVYFLQPPYESQRQKSYIKMLRRRLRRKKDSKIWWKQAEEEFLAGGGTKREFTRYKKFVNKHTTLYKKQVKKGEYYRCTPGYFLVTIGRKPKRMRRK